VVEFLSPRVVTFFGVETGVGRSLGLLPVAVSPLRGPVRRRMPGVREVARQCRASDFAQPWPVIAVPDGHDALRLRVRDFFLGRLRADRSLFANTRGSGLTAGDRVERAKDGARPSQDRMS
jgi:hypothetical protein